MRISISTISNLQNEISDFQHLLFFDFHIASGAKRIALTVKGDGVTRHGPEDERAFEPEIDPARPFGQNLAQRHEQKWRRDADRASDDGDDAQGTLHTAMKRRMLTPKDGRFYERLGRHN